MINLGSFSRLCILPPEENAWFLAGQSQHSSGRQHKQSRMTDRDHYPVWGCHVTFYLPLYHDFTPNPHKPSDCTNNCSCQSAWYSDYSCLWCWIFWLSVHGGGSGSCCGWMIKKCSNKQVALINSTRSQEGSLLPYFFPFHGKKIVPFFKTATPDWLLPMLLFAMHWYFP